MVLSSIGKVAKRGAAWATVAWVHQGLMNKIVDACNEGNRWQRMGVADVLSNAVARGHDRPGIVDRLRSLINDSEKEVRDVASGVFRINGLYEQPSSVMLVDAFFQSRALDDNIDDLLHGLDGFTGSLKPYTSVICGLADRFAGPLAAEARNLQSHRPIDANSLAKVLLRLYEQSEHDRVLRRKCLDAWDGLLSQGIGHDVLKDIDA